MSFHEHHRDPFRSISGDAPANAWRRRLLSGAVVAIVCAGLGGCVAGTEMAVTRYQLDPYEGSAQSYERTVTVDTARGMETRTCRTRSQTAFGPFGPSYEPVARTCEEAPSAYGGEPIAPDAVPRSVYRSPDRNPLPTAAIPN